MTRLAAIAVVLLLLGSVAGAQPHHGHKREECRPTERQRAAAGAFAEAVASGLYRYVDVAQAVLEGYRTDGKPTNAIMHYDSQDARPRWCGARSDATRIARLPEYVSGPGVARSALLDGRFGVGAAPSSVGV